MEIVTDLHLHSRFSRAVSPQMTLQVVAAVAKQKGVHLLSSSDFTHPLWFRELKSSLHETSEGVFGIHNADAQFLLATEVSCIYSDKGKGRRIHNLIFVPTMDAIEKINAELVKRGNNIHSDGRPILGISSLNLLELILTIDERCMVIPAHAWTPWFGIYGQMSGYDSLTEAFGNLSKYVYAIETGLSSDPEMNWKMEELNTRSIVSFSDAHSPAKMGRELTIVEIEKLTYESVRHAIMAQSLNSKSSQNKVSYTTEFYPEEGKYHYSGHRNCHVVMTPEEQVKAGGICPVCGRKLTDGVLRRVDELGKQTANVVTEKDANGLKWFKDGSGVHPPFLKLVPLLEIIAESVHTSVASQKAKNIYEILVSQCKSELEVLLHADISEIQHIAGERVAEGISRVRSGDIVIHPGYDGVYGTVTIWPDNEKQKEQLSLLE